MKNPTGHLRVKAPYLARPIPIKPWDVISDVLQLPISSSLNKFVLIFVDNFSRYIEAEPLPAVNGEIVSNTLIKNISCRHECPTTLICDNASYYVHGEFERVCKILGIKIGSFFSISSRSKRNCRAKRKSVKSSAQVIDKRRQNTIGISKYHLRYWHSILLTGELDSPLSG